MTTDTRTDPFDIVCGDPSAYFELPQAIVDDATLTRSEKLQLLDEWTQDISDRSSATGEGMISDKPGLVDHDIKLAAQIVAARLTVEAGEDRQIESLPLRLWKRLTGASA